MIWFIVLVGFLAGAAALWWLLTAMLRTFRDHSRAPGPRDPAGPSGDEHRPR